MKTEQKYKFIVLQHKNTETFKEKFPYLTYSFIVLT